MPDALQELIFAYDEYIGLLTEHERALLGLAYVHGYNTPGRLSNRGTELREKIATLKAELGK